MKRGSGLSLAVVLAATLFTDFTFAADPPAAGSRLPGDPAPVPLEVYKLPTLRKMGPMDHPRREAELGHDGWVQLNMMIDTKGRPYEVTVVESSGNEVLEKAAVDTIQKTTFNPATLGGRPVDAAMPFKFRFKYAHQTTGARREFIAVYKRLQEALRVDDRAGFDAALTTLEARNLYEYAFKNVALFGYYRKWGTEAQQLAALRQAIAYETNPSYLPKDEFVSLLKDMFVLQVKASDLGSALDTWEQLAKMSPEKAKSLQPALDQIQAVLESDASYSMPVLLERTGWQTRLLKDRFQIVVHSGKVADLKLRCEKQYLFFHYEPSVQYRIDGRNAQTCSIEIVGDPGTTLDLIQS